MIEILIFLILFFFKKNINNFILSNLFFLLSFLYLKNLSWIKWIFIFIDLSINFYSMYLILLMFWIFSLIFLNLKKFSNICLMLNMMLMFLMMLNFMSMNLLMYYFMYESSLLMIFYMIMKWGYSEERLLASFYLMFYTLTFSLPMLYLIFKFMDLFGSLYFFYLEFMELYIDNFNFLYMLMSFLVKIPMYLFHGWLVKAHVEASFFSSMILASIMLKLGSYGLLRLMFMFKFMFKNIEFLMSISIMGMLILSIMCLIQFDMKLIIAMSSVIHMSLMILGMLTEMKSGILGGLMMMLSHGLVSSGLFYLVNMIYFQSNSRLMFLNKGMMNLVPSMSMMWFMMCIYNSGAPISLSMISEIILLICMVNWCKYLILFLLFYCFLSFMYSIYLFSFIQHGKIYNFMINMFNYFSLNYLTLILHLMPLNMFIMNLFIY